MACRRAWGVCSHRQEHGQRQDVPGEAVQRGHGAGGRHPHRAAHAQGGLRGCGGARVCGGGGEGGGGGAGVWAKQDAQLCSCRARNPPVRQRRPPPDERAWRLTGLRRAGLGRACAPERCRGPALTRREAPTGGGQPLNSQVSCIPELAMRRGVSLAGIQLLIPLSAPRLPCRRAVWRQHRGGCCGGGPQVPGAHPRGGGRLPGRGGVRRPSRRQPPMPAPLPRTSALTLLGVLPVRSCPPAVLAMVSPGSTCWPASQRQRQNLRSPTGAFADFGYRRVCAGHDTGWLL